MDTNEIPVANAAEHAWNDTLWCLYLGAYGETSVYIWASNLEDALEELSDWAADTCPELFGFLTEDDYRAAADDVGAIWPTDPVEDWEGWNRIFKAAEADLYIPMHTTYPELSERGLPFIPWWEIGVAEIDPDSDEYAEVSERSLLAIEESGEARLCSSF
jgi:hypothetical protein